MRLSLITVWLVSLCHGLSFPSDLPAQNWEYALSQREFLGSTINDLAVIDDKVILAGALGSCASPAFWVFDTSGNFINYQVLETNHYEYGMITDINYDSIRQEFSLLAIALLADDVPAPANFVWKFNSDLIQITSLELSGQDGFDPFLTRIQDKQLSVIKEDSLYIYDESLNIINKIKITNEPRKVREVILADSVILVEESFGVDSSLMKIFNWNAGIVSTHKILAINKLLLLNTNLISLGQDHVLRSYQLPDFKLLNSVALSFSQDIDLNKISKSTMEVVQYNLHKRTSICHYDHELNLVRELPTQLLDELQIRGKFLKGTYFQTGKYFGYRQNNNYDYPHYAAIMPYVRKMNLENLASTRMSIEITQVSIKNPLIPLETFTAPTGEISHRYDQDEPLIYEITFRNSSDTVVHNFCYYNDEWYSVNCHSYNGHKYIENLQLRPGEQIAFLDTIFLSNLVFEDRGLLFYVAAPNHLLSDSSVTAYQVLDFTTATLDFKPPESRTLSVYPNPAEDFLSVKMLSSPLIRYDAEVEIISSTGHKVLVINSLNEEIDIRNLSSGIYFIRYKNDQIVYHGSFVKT